MAELLRKRNEIVLNDGVKVIQEVTKENSMLEYTAMRVLEVNQGASYSEDLQKWEVCIVALTGKISVTEGDNQFDAIGRRESVFDRVPTDSVYVTNDKSFTVKADSDATVILCYAPSDKQLPTRLIKAEENLIEDRGKNSNKRHVHNILDDQSDYANSLLVVEVFTDSGNWSSYPPHKHDQDNLPEESFLEEIYYHEMNPPQGFVFQRVYTEDRSIDETMAVYNQDAVLVPAGYHPVAVPDGYNSYYLNIMAGPTKQWKFHNEVAHEWLLKQ